MREKLPPLAPTREPDTAIKLERSLLKDQALDLLRDYIVSGRLRPGTKLVERDLAALLGISRAPVRDALLQLEIERLVVSKPNDRYVIELSNRDVREIYQVRRALEKLAVELAAQNSTPQGRATLAAKLEEMGEAIARGDLLAYVECDVQTHRLIWQQAQNAHLHDILNSMVGPIFMFVSSNATFHEWSETHKLHQELAACIGSGDVAGAVSCIERHMDNALAGALRTFGEPEDMASEERAGLHVVKGGVVARDQR